MNASDILLPIGTTKSDYVTVQQLADEHAVHQTSAAAWVRGLKRYRFVHDKHVYVKRADVDRVLNRPIPAHKEK